MEREWSTTRPGRVTPGKEPHYPEQSGQFEKRKISLSLPGFEPQIGQLVA
jgi:hypothetical protein